MLMIIKLLARELALSHFILILMRRNGMFRDGVAVTFFNGLGIADVGGGYAVVVRLGGVGVGVGD